MKSILTLCLLLPGILSADWLPGFYISTQGDTIQAQFKEPFLWDPLAKRPNYWDYNPESHEHIYFKDKLHNKGYLTPLNAKEYDLFSNGDTLRMCAIYYNAYCAHPAHELKNFNLPDFYQSESQFVADTIKKFNFKVMMPLNNQFRFYGECYSLHIKKEIIDDDGYRWSLPIENILQNRLVGDMVNFNDSASSPVTIAPTIEVFYHGNYGPLLMGINCKVRIHFKASDAAHHVLLDKAYEAMYRMPGLGKTIEDVYYVNDDGACNEPMGICLRMALDKFYEDLFTSLGIQTYPAESEPAADSSAAETDLSAPALAGYRPNNLVFLVDVSRSMGLKLGFVKKALYQLSEAAKDTDLISVVAYSDRLTLLANAVNGNIKARLHNAIRTLRVEGQDDNYNPILYGQELAQSNFIPGGNNQVFLVSDQKPKLNQCDLDIWKARQGGKPVILSTIAFGRDPQAMESMAQLAAACGGSFIHSDKGKYTKDRLLEEVKQRSRR